MKTLLLGLAILTASSIQAQVPDDFGFVFQGVGANHILNTFENSFTFDADTSSIKVDLELKEKDKARILKLMMDIDFFEFPSELEQRSRDGKISMTNQSTAVFLMVRMGGKTKEVECPSLYAQYDHKSEFLDLVELIQETLKSQKEYRKVQAGKGV